jgi:hypothetical protein
MKSISLLDQNLMEQFQPYKGTLGYEVRGHPLRILDALWNADKHRTITLVGLASLETTVVMPEGVMDPKVFAGPFKNGDILASSPSPFTPSGQDGFGAHVVPTVFFDQSSPAPVGSVRDRAYDMYRFVREEVFRVFEERFVSP